VLADNTMTAGINTSAELLDTLEEVCKRLGNQYQSIIKNRPIVFTAYHIVRLYEEGSTATGLLVQKLHKLRYR
jgi:hypothetical protein